MLFIILLVLFVLIMLPLFIAYRNMITGKKLTNFKRALFLNLTGFAVVCLVGVILPLGGFVSAATVAAATGTSLGAGLAYIGMAISTGLACVGAGIAVAQASGAAIGAITENPKMLGRAMIFVVLGEGIAIYGLAISFIIFSRIS
jgi:V/A-type H+-transporting ATPase subunit K